jgi:hypothetical protein
MLPLQFMPQRLGQAQPGFAVPTGEPPAMPTGSLHFLILVYRAGKAIDQKAGEGLSPSEFTEGATEQPDAQEGP